MRPHAVQVERVWDAAVGSALDRRTTFVALGGGVIGDMTGFAAAAYQRGVHFLQVHYRPCMYAHPVPMLTFIPPAHRSQCKPPLRSAAVELYPGWLY